MVDTDRGTVELGQREVHLLLKYGYPFADEKAQLEAFQGRAGPHRLKIDDHSRSMMIADLVRSAKTIHSGSILDELDALCCALEAAEKGWRGFGAVK